MAAIESGSPTVQVGFYLCVLFALDALEGLEKLAVLADDAATVDRLSEREPAQAGAEVVMADPVTKPVWVWPPAAIEPLRCGTFTWREGLGEFAYDHEYMDVAGTVPLDPANLPFTCSLRPLRRHPAESTSSRLHLATF